MPPIVDAVELVQARHPEVFVGQFGDTSVNEAVVASFSKDLKNAGLISIPITLFILVIAFGSLVAAGVPLLLGLTAVLTTLGLIVVPSQVLPMDESVHAIVLLIGLAVGVDYAMFYLKREREERAAGRGKQAALEAAAETSGHSVLVSGMIVMVAMAGMFLAGDAAFASFGAATITVVAVAMIGSLTVLPAVLSKLGDNVERLRVPYVSRFGARKSDGRIWRQINRRVMHRPLIAVLVAGGLLVALSVPAVQLRTAQPGLGGFPQDLPVIQTFNRMQDAFPGTGIAASVVVKASSVEEPQVRAAIDDLKARALASGQMRQPITVDVNAAGTVANVAIPIDGEGTDSASNAALATLRGAIVPETVGALPEVESGVTGMTAASQDGNDQLKQSAPLVFAFVLVFAFGLMLFAFRSIVIATKAVLLNVLSVSAAYGVLVLVFQHGVGASLLGVEQTGDIVPFLPILLFVVLFGLSMDYHVFILSRIREAREGGATTQEAITHGLTSTAGVVTSAAVVMMAVFSVFGALSMIVFKQFGVGLAAAVLIDATIVRVILLPATMALLGEANWYVPRWLNWLPGGQLETNDDAAAQAVPIGSR